MNTKVTLVGLVIIAGIGGLFLLPKSPSTATLQGNATTSSSGTTGDVTSPAGIHWHPTVSIIIKGEKQTIPANIGIGMQYAGYKYYDSMMMMTNIHTHDASGQLHWEVMEGPVTKDEVLLKDFFDIWGKAFSSTCIFENCGGSGGTVTMLVNGNKNNEFENYQVKDGDKIEIRYE